MQTSSSGGVNQPSPHSAIKDSVSGRWVLDLLVSEGIDRVALEIVVVEGTKVTGTITRTIPAGIAPMPFSGIISGNEIEFSIVSPDKERTITFFGRISGNVMEFKRTLKGSGGGDGIYGEFGPAGFSMHRQK